MTLRKIYFFYFFINSPNCPKQSFLGWNLFYLSKKCPKTNLIVSQYQISTSFKRSGKQLASEVNFISFFATKQPEF